MGFLFQGVRSGIRWCGRPAWSSAAAAGLVALIAGASQPGPPATWADAEWAVFRDKVEWALGRGVGEMPMGDAVAAMGRTMVGTPYVPHTLEAPGPEALVIGLRGLDCVTFVENALALARFVREPDARELLSRREAAERRYEEILTRIRYRGGTVRGYASRLHYFSEWIADGEAKGLVRDVTRELGGVPDTAAVYFMSTHANAYRQLGEDPDALAEIRRVEARLSASARWWIPEDGVEAAAAGIRDGDIIALTSTVAGMDVAHTGLAIWVEGSLRLMHAPLVGDSVEISAEELSARVRRIRSQDGITVARPR